MAARRRRRLGGGGAVNLPGNLLRDLPDAATAARRADADRLAAAENDLAEADKVARAALEAVGYQTRDLIRAMTMDSGLAIESLRVDGGMAANDWAIQFLADILPARVERPASLETTAWGAAYVAGLARGLCPEPQAMMARWSAARAFTPAMEDSEREERHAGWRRAVAGVVAAAAP